MALTPARARRLLEKPDERGQCPFDDLDIGVEEQDEFPGGAAVRLIDRRREAEVVVVSDQDLRSSRSASASAEPSVEPLSTTITS